MLIQLNPRYKVSTDGNDRFAVFRMRGGNPDVWDMVRKLEGPRRILLNYLDRHNITPTREAQKQLDELPECAGFREDPVEEEEDEQA